MPPRRLAFTLPILFLGCGEKAPIVSAPPVAIAPTRNPKIPIEVSYPVTNEWSDATRRGVDVLLNQKVTPEVLREIALEIKSRETRQYQRTLITYHLPEFDPAVKSYSWATTHFAPTLDVQINQSSIAAERSVRDLKVDKRGLIFGPWFREYGCCLDFIFRDGEAIKMASCYQDGGRHDSALVEVPEHKGRRFKLKSSHEEYEVDEWGTLRVYGFGNKMIDAVPQIKE